MSGEVVVVQGVATYEPLPHHRYRWIERNPFLNTGGVKKQVWSWYNYK